jgi:hypothetical protein
MVPGPANMRTIKGDDFINLSHDIFVSIASMMPEPLHRVTWLQCSP